LQEAGLADFEPWEMKTQAPRHHWGEGNNRVYAVKWLVGKKGKDPRKITANDFIDCSLRGLLYWYGGSPAAALKEAGYDIEEKPKPANPAELLKRYIQK